jgi:hypothetical protein
VTVIAIMLAQGGGSGAELSRVSGVVTAVEGPSVALVSRFTLRARDGRTLSFEVRSLALDGGGKPAPHLREHMASGVPIEVDYRDEGGLLVALRYRDLEP